MIQVENLSKYYGEQAALANVDLQIEEGELVGVLGLNGAGKTTLLRILSATLLPTAGTVRIGEVDLEDDAMAIRRQVGFMPESPPLYAEMSVSGFLKFVGGLKGMRADSLAHQINETSLQLGLGKVLQQPIGTLSYGYQQRVGLAQALLHNPRLLILDEPNNGLDPLQVVEMRQLIRSLKGRHTVLISSHNLGEIQKICDRLLVIQNGRIVAEGTEEELSGRTSAGRRWLLTIRGNGEVLMQFLEEQEDLGAAELLREEDGCSQVAVNAAEDRIESLNAALIEAGYGLRRVQPAGQEFEDVLIRLLETPEEAA